MSNCMKCKKPLERDVCLNQACSVSPRFSGLEIGWGNPPFATGGVVTGQVAVLCTRCGVDLRGKSCRAVIGSDGASAIFCEGCQ